MIRTPPIAILMPVFNGARHLGASLQSALAQTGVDFEVWVSDDGSTDGSVEILRRFRDPKLQVLPQARHSGLFANLNRLIRASRNPFFHILCQDDILEPDCLARELERFSRSPHVGLTFSKSTTIDDSGRVLGRGALHDLPYTMRPSLCLQHFFYHGCIPSNLSTVALRRSATQKVGLFDESFRVSGDFELWTRICRHYAMGIIHAHTVQIRSHAGQLSRADSSGPDFISENRAIRRRIVPDLPVTIQTSARAFERLRFGVLDFHFAMRSLLRGRYHNAHRVLQALGLHDSVFGALTWLLSLNNRLFRPTAKFVLPADYSLSQR